jgi:polysaccharide biosynthesis/export protein
MAVLLAVLANLAAAPESGDAHFASREARYRICTGDVMEVNFRFTPEFNQTLAVQPDGFVTLQSAGDVKISGLSVPEATAAIIGKYKGILNEPAVSVVLKEFNKPFFLVGGEVAKPGKFDLRGPVTLTEAVTIAGGFTPNAKQTEVLLFRHVSGDLVEAKKVDVKRAIEKSQLAEDLMLQPGDVVYVSKSWVGKVDRFMSVTRMGMYCPIPVKF